jgi:transcriptional regulator
MSERDLKVQLRGFVAFKLKISRIEASWKLSQNRNDTDYYEIIARLRERGDQLSD